MDANLITGIRESTNAENSAMVEATNYLDIFKNNIDYAGKADAQQHVEYMCELMDVPNNERAGRAKQMAELFVANQIKSKMDPVHKQLGSAPKNRVKVSDWAKFYTKASRWEAFFVFIWEGLQGIDTLSKEQKSGSDFIGLKSYELLKLSFIDNEPEVGPYVSMVGCKHFEHMLIFDVPPPPEISKPKKRKVAAAAKVAPPQKTAKTVGNTRQIWMAQGREVNTWTAGMWDSMSESERYNYRNGRSQSGLWSSHIPVHLRCNPGKKISVC
jgi:hypothetical protein